MVVAGAGYGSLLHVLSAEALFDCVAPHDTCFYCIVYFMAFIRSKIKIQRNLLYTEAVLATKSMAKLVKRYTIAFRVTVMMVTDGNGSILTLYYMDVMMKHHIVTC